MKIKKSAHKCKLPPLTDEKSPYGVIDFLHGDGTTHTFYSVVNEMSGDRLSAFDGNAPTVNDTMPWVKSVFKDIHRKATVLATLGKLAEK